MKIEKINIVYICCILHNPKNTHNKMFCFCKEMLSFYLKTYFFIQSNEVTADNENQVMRYER